MSLMKHDMIKIIIILIFFLFLRSGNEAKSGVEFRPTLNTQCFEYSMESGDWRVCTQQPKAETVLHTHKILSYFPILY